MNRRILVVQFILIAAALVAAIAAYPHLPAQIATHWNTHLQADGYSGRSAVFWLGPGLMAAVVLFARVGPWLSPTRYNVASFEPTWQRMMLLVFLLMTGVFATTLWSALGHVFDAGRWLAAAFCLFIIAFGNLLGKVRPNFFLGIRTPWTLASERVWIATHRVAAWSTAFSGLCGLILVLAGRPQWSVLPFLVALAASAVYSLVLSKRMTTNDLTPHEQ